MSSFFLSEGSFAQLSTVGTEFYFGFMENNLKENNEDKALISITASEDAIGYIQYLGKTINFSIAKGKIFTHEIPTTATEDIIHRSSGVIRNKGVYIFSSGKIAVHAFNLRSTSSDGSVILPFTAIGKDYIVTAHYNDISLSPNNFESTVLIVSAENNTEVEINPTVPTVNGFAAGSPVKITLNKGQSYQLKGQGDLTGTRVKVVNSGSDDCKRVAVFGGNKMTQGGTCGSTSDHLFQQTYPLFTWGKEFIHIPLLERTAGELVKVVASQNNTTIEVSGLATVTLNEGEFYIYDFKSTDIATIKSDKPIATTAIAKSQDCDTPGPLKFGDPLMITYNPNNERISSIVFNSLQSYGFLRHFVNVIVPAESVNETILNGKNIGDQFKAVPGNPNFHYAQIKLSGGTNSLSNPKGLIAYAYGTGNLNSYGFSAGANFESSEYEADSKYEFEVVGERVACFGQEATWMIQPESKIYTQFKWDFGDGSDPVFGQEAKHTFTKEGKFTVSVLASNGAASCALERTYSFDVEVLKVLAEIKGETNVCPGSTHVYELGETVNFEKLEWLEVIGGEIVSQSANSLTVKWSETSDAGQIKAVAFAPNGCRGEEIILDIELGSTGLDVIPLGPESICGIQEESLVYEIPADFEFAGSILWEVIGGKITGEADQKQVAILWDDDAEVRKVFFTLTNTEDACGGISKKLTVEKLDKILFENAQINGNQEVCLGSEITYTFSSTTPFGNLDWVDVRGGSILETGNDFVKIRWIEETENMGLSLIPYNESDCPGELISLEIRIKESEVLPKPKGIETLCGPDFLDQVYEVPNPQTGVQYSWAIQGGEIIGENSGKSVTVRWKNSSEGKVISYSEQIQDQSVCPRSSEVLKIKTGEPILLQEQIETLASCPGETNGALEIKVKGGTGNYEFEWEGYPTVKGNKLENIAAGEYQVTVKDVSGCGIAEFSLTLSDHKGLELTRELEYMRTTCSDSGDGGFIAYLTGGKAPYKVEGFDSTWDGEKLTVKGLSKGPFTLFILDATNCSLAVDGVIGGTEELKVSFVEESESCPGGSFGRLAVKVEGGVGPYQYAWDLGSGISEVRSTSSTSNFGSNFISDMPSGEYAVTVTDSNGCQVMAYGRISETSPQVRMPTGYLPSDGLYYPVSNCSLNYTLKVFDRWGGMVYVGTEGWDGMIKGNEAPVGTYTFVLSYTFSKEGEIETEEKSGIFTLIR